MKSLDFLNEGIAEDAHEMHLDHEVQMARKELYHAAEDAIALHKLLRHVSEQQGLEGWVSSKITLAADYLNTVREHLEYQLMSGGPAEEVVAVVGDAMPVAESEKNPHTSALGKALHRDLSKEKKASPQQVQRNKERWAKRQAEREQGVAEGWDPDTTRLEQDVRDALENGDDYTAKQYAKMAPTPEAKKYLLNIIKQAMYIDDLGGETDWKGVAEATVNEMSAGSVATVVNPPAKNKAKVGSLFGGTYKQKQTKAK
jgi:hypothetical protein